MATGTGKTKVLSLLVAWSFFHKLYEAHSTLARNFLIITPNIIVLDRIRSDFEGLKIFFNDPILPENGFEGQNWKNDFQLNLHLQDNIGLVKKTGNIFLTNIQRIYTSKEQSPYKAIVSVLMLKEGWDVKNVTTIVGLRAYTAQSNILPEQTLGRGLRRMYWGREDITEYVSVVGTPAFMDFVESIQHEGVELETKRMGEGTEPNAPLLIEIDEKNIKKDIQKLDIEIPILSPRICREYKKLSELNPSQFSHKKIEIKQFSEEEKKEIVFRDITSGEITHKTLFDSNFIPSYSSVIGYFAETIRKELRLFGSHDILYGKVKEFIINYLFTKKIKLDNLNILRNLSELEVTKTIIENFKKEINNLTVVDKGDVEIRDYIKISKSRPFVIKEQSFVVPKKSAFNKIVGDSHFELEFASFLKNCDDIISYAKNYFSVHFKIDYQTTNGEIKDYYPDFLIKTSEKEIYIVETKGREDLDDIKKIERLYQWCTDINQAQKKIKFMGLYIKQEEYEKYKPSRFSQLKNLFCKNTS